MTGSEKSGADNGSPFLQRWSQRKAQTQTLDAEPETPELPAQDVDRVPESESLSVERVLTDDDMPPLSSLDESADFGGFLSPGVSDSLKKAALKKLFSLPSCGALDGLNDYDDDYTCFEPLGDIVTAEMQHRAIVDAEREARKHLDDTLMPTPDSSLVASEDSDDERPDETTLRLTEETPDPTDALSEAESHEGDAKEAEHTHV